MKFLKGKFVKKLVAMVLVGATVVGLTQHMGKINSKAEEVTKQEEISELDGLEKSIEIDEQEVVKCESKDISSRVTEVTSYKEDGSKTVNEVTSEGIKTYYYDEFGEMVYEENMDFDAFGEASINTRAPISDYVQVYEIFNFKHWYMKWCNGRYLDIGCDKKYTIDYKNLSKGKKGNCDAYMDAIKASNVMVTAAATALIFLCIAVKNAYPSIAAAILKLAGEGMTKKQIVAQLVKQFAMYSLTKESAKKAVDAVYKVVDVIDFASTRKNVKKYYKIIREYSPSYNL